MDYITFGSITFQIKWLLLIVALFTGFIILKFLNKTPSIIMDKISNSLFIGLIVLKLSLVLVEPKLVVKDPLSLLYFSGGEIGCWLAILIAGIVYFWSINRGKIQFQEGYKSIYFFSLYSFIIYHFLFLFFHFSWEHVLNLLFSLGLIVWSFKRKGLMFFTSTLIFAFYQILLSNVFSSVEYFQYFFYTLIILALLIVKKKHGSF